MHILLLLLLIATPCQAGLFDIPEPTRQELLRQRVSQIKQYIKVSQERHEADQKTAFDRIWNDVEFTPQEIIAEFGTDAAELFIKSVTNETCIKQINPSWEMMSAPYAVNLNADGSVTVGECIAQSCMPEPENVETDGTVYP